MATKIGRLVACIEELSPIESLGSLITWLCEVTGQIKYVIQYLAACKTNLMV